MLPFLRDKKRDMITTLLDNRTGKRTETSGDIESKESPSHDAELEQACTDLLNAIERKSIPDIRDAFHAAFQACENKPHSESPHTEQSESEEEE